MKRRRFQLSMPLMGRELSELAARKRTYTVRTMYAVVLFSFCLLSLQSVFARGVDPALVAGAGRPIFKVVVWAQVIGIFALLPAMMADAITHERERNSLDLMMLTALGPWDIVVQKLAARLIPMGTLVMLSLPLMAVAYGCGGISTEHLWATIYLLALACVQVGAICMSACADAPNTSTAMVRCYSRLPVIYLVMAGIGLVLGILPWALAPANSGVGYGVGATVCLTPLLAVVYGLEVESLPLWWTVLFSLPAVGTIWFFLHTARRIVEKGDVLGPTIHRPLHVTLATLAKDRQERHPGSVPDEQPIEWRERTSYLVAKLTTLYAAVACIVLPVACLIAGRSGYDSRIGQSSGMTTVMAALWLAAAGVMGMLAAWAVVSEKMHQSIEVLLTLPLSTRRLLEEKSATVLRLARWLVLLFAIVIIAEMSIEFGGPAPQREWAADPATYLACHLLALMIYLPLSVWVGVWIGLGVRTHGRAVAALFAAGAVWLVALPWFIGAGVELLPTDARPLASYLRLLSPASLVMVNEANTWGLIFAGPPWLPIALNFAFYGLILRWVKRHCLMRADDYLGRLPQPMQPALM